jgi:cell division protein ZapA
MCKVRDAGKIKARDRIAVLAALNLAFEQPDATAAPATSEPGLSAGDDDRLKHLLKRLDQALHQDGQLI